MKRLFLSDIALNIQVYSDQCYFFADGKTHKRKVLEKLGTVPTTIRQVRYKSNFYEIR